jgi:acetylornithine/N-succinyldiaminopimelate aminotransferase
MSNFLSSQETVELYEKYLIGNYIKQPIAIVRGQGSYIWDAEGRRYLDLFSGWAVTVLGHCHPRLVAALGEQAATLIYIANIPFHNQPAGRLAKLLSENSFGGKCFFCNSGAEAVEAAIKLARLATPKEKYKLITFENSFHGRTFGAISATAQSKYHQGFQPLLAGFEYLPLNDLDAVRRAVDDETCGIMVEPIQGEGGINICTPEFLRGLRELCDERGLILIFDEVQTGLGRTGKMFAYQHYGVVPDIMALAKHLGGGVPIGAIVAKPQVAAAMKPGTHASTYGGNPLAAAAACAVIETIIDEKLLDHAREVGAYTMQKLRELGDRQPRIKEVRGLGLMIGIELTDSGAGVFKKCLEKGLLINCTHDVVLRFMPALTVTQAEIDEGLAILELALKEAQ